MVKKATKLDLRFQKTRDEIREVCRGLRSLEQCGLKTDLLVLMLNDATGVNKTQCRAILDALPRLESKYLKGPRS